jgi:bifunctional non-homologous end joining protein LigD
MADPLDRYRAMRDFSKTAEPAGKSKVSATPRLRFVIQKHAATRLHYDLRLEHEGVFLSWAVTRGPSLDPDEKRLAVEVEPHPLDYGDFEGTIPKGQYGGGTVMLWDRGWWEPEPGRTIDQALKKGHLIARFEGERMRGAWHLVLIRNDKTGGKRRNWLFFKAHDGHERPGDADAFLKANASSIASGRTMEAIAAGEGPAPKPFMVRGRRTSAKAVWSSNRDHSAVEKVAPKAPAARSAAIPDFVEPQLAKLIERPPADGAWAHEIKFDGYRMQLRVHAGTATLRTRNGLDWTDRFPEVARDGAKLPEGLYDGELCALDDQARPSFPALQSALSEGRSGDLVLFLFDALWLDGEDVRERPLHVRKARLKAALEAATSSRLRYVEHFETAGGAVLRSACRMELEGVVSKRLNAQYRSGRSESWLKSKCRGGQEVVIGGWATTGGAKFRSLLVGVRREDGTLRHVGRVGTGFGREVVDRILPRLETVAAEASPFSGPGAPRKTADIHWARPELVAEIEFAGWTADGSIRQASFKGLREDKPATAVTAETSARDGIMSEKRAPKATGNVVLGVTISNPDKALWPATDTGPEVPKIELARYFEAAAERLLPYVRGRPCSMVRTPDGIEGEQRFFQRHAGAGTSNLVTLVPVRGDKKPYLQLDTPEALVAVAQSGATELHPWNCLPFQPETPGRFVFDLDPDETVSFERVIEAAEEIRDRLERYGLTGHLKTTGGKGLHVVVPLTQPEDEVVAWPEAKAFAKRICEEAAADSPDRYTTNMSKKQRTSRIFLDYLRNDRLSTAVALLSPRARSGAPVSFPLTWAQAKTGLDPRRYTIRTALNLLAGADPWAGYDAAARPLAEAIRAGEPQRRSGRSGTALRTAAT